MKRLRVVWVAALVGAGCSGQIDHGSATRPSSSGTGGTGGMTSVPPPSVPACAQTGLPPTRLWRLTHQQFRNTLADAFGFVGQVAATFPQDSRLDGFANDADHLAVSPLLTEYYYRAADELAADVIRRSGEFLTCPVADLGKGTCLGDFLTSFAGKAWRRPTTDDDLAKLRDVYTIAATATDPPTGLRMVIEAVILSPHFLFRTELGPAGAPAGKVTALTDYELASALSYALWDAPPDAGLLGLASAGKLHDAATLRAEAKRMLASSKKAPASLDAFVQQWLKIDDLASAQKDPTLFPGYDAQVAQDLLEENRRFVNGVVFEAGGDHSLRTLLTAPTGYVNQRTAKLYGATATGTDLTRANLDASQRRGLLTQAAFMAAHADGDATRLVDRGRFVREEVLCLDVPPPPGDFKFMDPKITDDMTQREKLTIHAANPACASCHTLFDGIGFAMEAYDPVGQFRTLDKGKKIDTTGTLPLPDRPDLQFANFVELVDQLAKLPEPYQCFSGRYLQYATGRGSAQINECERTPIAKAFVDSGYDVNALMLAVVTSPGFVARKN
jgi:hypothetical protein